MATEFYQQKNPYYVRYSGYMKYPYSDYKQPFMSYYSKSLGPIGGMAEDRNNRDRYSHFRVEYPGIMNPVEVCTTVFLFFFFFLFFTEFQCFFSFIKHCFLGISQEHLL